MARMVHFGDQTSNRDKLAAAHTIGELQKQRNGRAKALAEASRKCSGQRMCVGFQVNGEDGTFEGEPPMRTASPEISVDEC